MPDVGLETTADTAELTSDTTELTSDPTLPAALVDSLSTLETAELAPLITLRTREDAPDMTSEPTEVTFARILDTSLMGVVAPSIYSEPLLINQF